MDTIVLRHYTFMAKSRKTWQGGERGKLRIGDDWVEKNLIIVNSGHRDFVFANRAKSFKLRYLTRLYTKEMVLKSFPGAPPDELLERMIELALYTEKHLK